MPVVTVQTWGGQSQFKYEGSVTEGTWISWIDNSKLEGWDRCFVTAAQYQSLLSAFIGQEISLGNYRSPAPGTLEGWMKEQPGQWGLGIASQLGVILIREGYAERGTRRGRLQFFTTRTPPADQVPAVVRPTIIPSSAPPRAVTTLARKTEGSKQPQHVNRLRYYFENADLQRQALNAVSEGRWLDAGGNFNLYEASNLAFDPSSPSIDRFENFKTIYEELKQPGKSGWNVFRPSSPADCWSAKRIFDTIRSEFAKFSWGSGITLLSFPASETDHLTSSIEKMRGIKPKQGFPTMTVSKFLHFYNPSLFPIFDYEVIWKVVFSRFNSDFRDFCQNEGISFASASDHDSAAFLPNYMRWASSLLSCAHDAFMQVFVEWIELQPGVELNLRKFDAARLYATAFEFNAIGAAKS